MNTPEEIRAKAEKEVNELEAQKARERAEHFGFIRPMGSKSTAEPTTIPTSMNHASPTTDAPRSESRYSPSRWCWCRGANENFCTCSLEVEVKQ